MPKLSLSPITSGYASVGALNANFQAIANAIENTLSRDGTSPNVMEANLDMDSNRILNLPAPLTESEAARLKDVQDATGNLNASLIKFEPYGPLSATTMQGAIQELVDDLKAGDVIDADDIVFTPDGSSAETRSVQDKLRETVSITDFGVKPDSAEDQATLIQAAIDAAAMAGKTLFVPAGTYYFATELKRPNNSYIKGEGMGVTIFKAHANLPLTSCGFTNAANDRTTSNAGNSNIYTADLTMDGNKAARWPEENWPISAGDYTSGCGFGWANVDGVIDERCESTGWPKHGFDYSATTYGDGSSATDSNTPPGTTIGQNVRCHASDCGDDNITSHFSTVKILFSRSVNPAKRNADNSNCIEIDDGSYDCLVMGNFCSNGHRGIEVKGHSNAPAARRVRVLNNVIEECCIGICARHISTANSENAKDVQIVGNIIRKQRDNEGIAGQAIEVQSYDGYLVAYNYCDNADGDTQNTGEAIAIWNGARNGHVIGNVFRNFAAATFGIRITTTAGPNHRVVGNTLHKSGTERGISVGANVGGVVIDQNDLTAPDTVTGTDYGIFVTSDPLSVYASIGRNTITGYTKPLSVGGVDYDDNEIIEAKPFRILWQNNAIRMYTTLTPAVPGVMQVAVGTSTPALSTVAHSTNSRTHLSFSNTSGSEGAPAVVGSITTSGSATAFNTSSDYRLKIVDGKMEGALDLVASLPVYQVRWKSDPEGPQFPAMLAHEIAAVAPYAVTGEKDAMQEIGRVVDRRGKTILPRTIRPKDPLPEGAQFKPEGEVPAIQMADYSKLVPLLVAAVQELSVQVAALRSAEGEK